MGRNLIELILELQRSILLKLPDEIVNALEKVLNDVESEHSKERAPEEQNDYGCNDYINVIPSKMECACRPILLTYCYDKDNFEDRIMESLDHASLKCPGINKEIYFLSTQWDSRCIRKTAGYIKAVRMNDVKVVFLHITNKGIVLMPA